MDCAGCIDTYDHCLTAIESFVAGEKEVNDAVNAAEKVRIYRALKTIAQPTNHQTNRHSRKSGQSPLRDIDVTLLIV